MKSSELTGLISFQTKVIINGKDGERDVKITEYKIGNVTVRFHGDPPPKEVLEKACVRFLKGVENDKREIERNLGKTSAMA